MHREAWLAETVARQALRDRWVRRALRESELGRAVWLPAESSVVLAWPRALQGQPAFPELGRGRAELQALPVQAGRSDRQK